MYRIPNRNLCLKKGVLSVWLICQAAIGRGKNKLLVRGIDGAEWVFCPLIKSIKRDRISTDRCQRCEHFIRFEQTYIPQKLPKKAIQFFRMSATKCTFQVRRASRRSRRTYPPTRLRPFISGVTEERQPLIDVFEEEDHLTILAELPGIDEKDLNIRADKQTLTISADNHTKNYLKEVPLPTPIKRDTIKFTYRNNILQVKLEKLKATTRA